MLGFYVWRFNDPADFIVNGNISTLRFWKSCSMNATLIPVQCVSLGTFLSFKYPIVRV